MPRSVEEWIGASDDAKVPDRVKLRIWRRQMDADGVVHCHISGEPIRPGDDFDLEHKQALIFGGRHAESNLAFALTRHHRQKTAEEVAIRAETDARALSHAGIRTANKTGLEGRDPHQKRAAKDRRTTAAGKLALPPRRSLYADTVSSQTTRSAALALPPPAKPSQKVIP